MSTRTHPRGPEISVDLLAAATLFLIAAVLLSQTGDGIRDWAMPRSLCYLIVGVGVVLLVKALVRPGEKVPLVPAVARREGLDTAFFIAAAVAYALVIPIFGFWLSSFVVLFVLSVAMAERRGLRIILQSGATAFVVCACAYLLMLHVFYVPLPFGSLFG